MGGTAASGEDQRVKFCLPPTQRESSQWNSLPPLPPSFPSCSRKPSIRSALMKCYGKPYLLVGLYKLFWGVFTWLCAYYFFKVMLVFLDSPLRPVLDGHMIALALFFSALFSSICIHQLYGECNRIGTQIKAALSVIVYRKSLKLARVRSGAGEIVNVHQGEEGGCVRVSLLSASQIISFTLNFIYSRSCQSISPAFRMPWQISTFYGQLFLKQRPLLSLHFTRLDFQLFLLWD